MEKPKDIKSYKKWLDENHSVRLTPKIETYYQTVIDKIKRDFIESNFWLSLQDEIEDFGRRYYMETSYDLLTEFGKLPDLDVKPYNSFVQKTFRYNVLNNNNWPDSPPGGWILPDNWFSRINDLVRTCVVVKYLDGVSFLAEELGKVAETVNLKSKVDFEAKEEGYYAGHFYVEFPCDIPCEDWDTREEQIQIEIQITTQLQEVIRRLLHKYYEERRVLQPTSGEKWQWNYRSDEFAANYLGHLLHYVEGMIMDVRDNQSGKDMK